MDYTVSLEKIAKEFSLREVYVPDNLSKIFVTSPDYNRPGLELTGYLDYFDKNRILIIGKKEYYYFAKMSSSEKKESLERFLSLAPPAMIFCRDLEPFDEIKEVAAKYNVSLLVSSDPTSEFTASLVSFLNVELAQRVTRHGVLVEVYGEGLLLMGDSGIGKSETAVELIKRGHRLIADDAVEIRRVSAKTLVGSSPANIRHFIELRGIGIINARRIYGMGAVKMTEKIDMVINLELWDNAKIYDRMGMETEYMEILGNKVPTITIPVKPGRNLAVIIEAAAMNSRQKKMGYNAAKELLAGLGMAYDVDDDSGKGSIHWER
ncbi:MAG: HPr(Ser) kinase/phosphatase [Lachnospiraceae bacterium]|nr:HPr(Ser) kinase/phosphatase [Lachnospiraceae bacterium]